MGSLGSRLKRRRKAPVKPSAETYTDIESKFKPLEDAANNLIVAVYGPPGSGKTTFAATFPKPLLLVDCKEKGIKSISNVKGITHFLAEDWSDLDRLIWHLQKNDGKYKTIVVDTLSQAEHLAIIAAIRDKGGDIKAGKKWGNMTKQQWGDVSTNMKNWLTDLKECCGDQTHLCIIAQEKVYEVSDEDQPEDDDQYIPPECRPNVIQSVHAHLTAGVDIIAHCNVTVRVNRKTKKHSAIYKLRIGPHNYYSTKVRKPKTVKTIDTIIDPDFRKLTQAIKGE